MKNAKSMRRVAVAASVMVAAIVSMPLCLADMVEDYQNANEAQGRDDFMVAMPLLKKAADEGYAPAQSLYGEMLDAAESNEEAVSYFIKAAEQGDARGQLGLAKMYGAGKGVKLDNEKAAYWLTKAAEQDYFEALKVIVNAYNTGAYGFKVDPEQEKAWGARLQVATDKFVKEQQEIKAKAKAAVKK
jgi:TPR repeat protein